MEKRPECFLRDKTGWIIVFLNLLMAGNSTLYFIAQCKTGVTGWLAMNSCAPSIFIFAIGFFLAHRTIMALAAGLMFRFGTLGLFVFSWEGMNIIPQAGHILMTVAVIYFAVKMLALKSFDEIIIAAGVVGILLYSGWQWAWFADHPHALEALFNGNTAPEMLR
jgi:hypothetical protein